MDMRFLNQEPKDFALTVVHKDLSQVRVRGAIAFLNGEKQMVLPFGVGKDYFDYEKIVFKEVVTPLTNLRYSIQIHVSTKYS